MLTKKLLAVLVAALAIPLALVAMRPGVSNAAEPLRIMPLGDSITGSPGCWRSLLWNRLQSSGYTNVDFVGTLPPQGCGVAHDGDNEGHGGFLAVTIAQQNLLPGWLSATRPDIVVMHLGTNDVWSNLPPTQILAAFSTLVDQMRASNPAMKILVAKIIPMNPSQCPDCGQRAVAFNNAIPAWASGRSTARSPITVVDQWTGFTTATDTYDGVHPNAAGDQKMADRWYPPLVAALTGLEPTQSPTPIPTVSLSTPGPTSSVSSTPSRTITLTLPPRSCSATYTQMGQWQGGFQGEVKVANPGTAPLSGWTVTLTWPDGQQISQLWNGSHTGSGSRSTVSNVSWNGAVAPGQTAAFGFLGSWTGANTAPSVACAAR